MQRNEVFSKTLFVVCHFGESLNIILQQLSNFMVFWVLGLDGKPISRVGISQLINDEWVA